jgi:hypothetical protein
MAEQPPRAVAMDPPHITEFASERYFEKLSQLNASQQQQQQQQHPLPVCEASAVSSASPTVASSTFILPLRETKTVEAEPIRQVEQKKDKSRFFGFRHKVSLLHSKPQAVDSAILVPLRSSTESTRKRFDPPSIHPAAASSNKYP